MPATIWDWRRGEVVDRVGTSAELVEFDPTGGLIATSRPVEGVADVWDARTGRRAATLTASAHVLDIAFDASGTRLATAHADGSIRLWDPETGVQDLVLHSDDHEARSVAFSPDGSMLVSMDDYGGCPGVGAGSRRPGRHRACPTHARIQRGRVSPVPAPRAVFRRLSGLQPSAQLPPRICHGVADGSPPPSRTLLVSSHRCHRQPHRGVVMSHTTERAPVLETPSSVHVPPHAAATVPAQAARLGRHRRRAWSQQPCCCC